VTMAMAVVAMAMAMLVAQAAVLDIAHHLT
jgi:hypothetical protein